MHSFIPACCAFLFICTYAILFNVPTVHTVGTIISSQYVLSSQGGIWHDACLTDIRYSTHAGNMTAVLQAPSRVCHYSPFENQIVLMSYALLDPQNVMIGPPVVSLGKLGCLYVLVGMMICFSAYMG
jgi:hypothetical protein